MISSFSLFMKVGLYSSEEIKGLFHEIENKINKQEGNSDIELIINEFDVIEQDNPEDALIIHPSDNFNNYWSKLKQYIKDHPKNQFHMVVMNDSKKENYFEGQDNLLIYNIFNIRDFFARPGTYLSEKWKSFSEKK